MGSSNEKKIYSIEGNIASGKSTLLERFKQDPRFCVVQEPVSDWMGKGTAEYSGRGKEITNRTNFLDMFYSDQKSHCFKFQLVCLISRYAKLAEAVARTKAKYILMERYIECDNNVFVKMMTDKQFMSPVEHKFYEYYYNKLNKFSVTPLFLDIEPELCYLRMTHRGRKEEAEVSLRYLQELDAYHQKWLKEAQRFDNDSLYRFLKNLP